MVPVELSRIIISETQESQVIVLKERDGQRVLPIWIGLFEAVAINRRIRGEVPQRPMTHDLLADLLKALSAQVEQVAIDRFVPSAQGGVFHAKLQVRADGRVHQIDCRPSDAIAVAVRMDAPLFVAEEILTEEGQTLGEDGEEPEPPAGFTEAEPAS